jgi:uroporphyrinogen decarboxylase
MFTNHQFQPDYRNIVDAARNKKPKRIPLYEHLISDKVLAALVGKRYVPTGNNKADLVAHFCWFADACRQLGYDTVCFEQCCAAALPGSGALGGHKDGVIKNRADFEKYPWDAVPNLFFDRFHLHFEAMGEALPPGMKCVGGVGNGVFEAVQDIVGFMDLCYIQNDDPALFADLFAKVGSVIYAIWDRFLDLYDDMFCVYRFGDDLGYKVSPLLAPDDIRTHILPQYQRIISLIKIKSGKPFLLHSCGNIFSIMDDIIHTGIDAKHSNEDVIAPFSEWVRRYNHKIALFGGIDTDVLCDVSGIDLENYFKETILPLKDYGGIAIGSGNSIPDYVNPARFARMNELVRIMRGE